MKDSPLVHLTSAGNNAEAALLRAYLEDHGIFCYVQGENHRSMLNVMGGYIELERIHQREGLAQVPCST